LGTLGENQALMGTFEIFGKLLELLRLWELFGTF